MLRGCTVFQETCLPGLCNALPELLQRCACLPYAHVAAWLRHPCKYSTCCLRPSLALDAGAVPSVYPRVSGSRLPRQQCEASLQPRAATPPAQLLAGFLRAPQVMARVPVDCKHRQTDVGCAPKCVRISEAGNCSAPPKQRAACHQQQDRHAYKQGDRPALLQPAALHNCF